MIKRILMSMCLMIGLVWPFSAAAQGRFNPDDVVQAQILPGWKTERGTYIAGLRLTLAPGWKTYWRAPGDAGIPPQFNWNGSDNMAGVQVHWPRPKVFHQSGMRSIGYEQEVVLPLELTLREDGAPVALRGEVQLGVCEEICVPVSLPLSAILSQQGGDSRAIRAALARAPMSAREAGVGRAICSVTPTRDGLQLRVEIPMRNAPEDVEAVVEAADPSIWVAEPVLSREGSNLVAVTQMVPISAQPFALDRSGLRITLLSASKAVEIQGCSGG